MLTKGIMKLNNFAKQKGATAVEYGLIAALVGVAAIAGMSALGGNLNKTFTDIGKKATVVIAP